MRNDDLEQSMRELEYFHGLRVLPGTWIVLRVDGRSFSRFTEERFEKPFDEAFHRHMVAAAGTLLDEMQGLYAFTESDEISVLLPTDWDLFDRELEKVVSISAGVTSAAFSLSCGEFAHFDSRVWVGTTEALVIDYFRWRQSDAGRCCLNGWCYWKLRDGGLSVRAATRELDNKGNAFKNAFVSG